MLLKNKSLKIFIVLLLLSCSFVSFCGLLGNSSSFKSAEAAEVSTIGESNVLDDLFKSTIDGKQFKLEDYPKNANGKLQMLHLQEAGYSYHANKMDSYELYVYVYNPQQKAFDVNSTSNKIQLANKFDSSGNPSLYGKYQLKFVNRSTDPRCVNVFYKYKILLGSNTYGLALFQVLNKDLRKYYVSGIEFKYMNSNELGEDTIARTWKYAGYERGLGQNAELNDLACTIDENETVELDVFHTSYRTGIASSAHKYYNIHTAYFSIDNKLLNRYDYLNRIWAEWYKCRTKEILVTSNSELRTKALANKTKKVGDSGHDNSYELYMNMTTAGHPVTSTHFEWIYNKPNSSLMSADYICNFIPIVLPTSDNFVKNSDLITYINSYSSNPWDSRLFDGDPEYVFTPEGMSIKDTFSHLQNYNATHGFWDRFIDFGLKVAFNNSAELKRDFGQIKVIEKVDSTILDSSNRDRWLVSERDYEGFKSYYSSQKALGKSVYVFRFDADEMESRKVVASPQMDGTHYVSKQNVYKDFDIIQISFMKQDEEVIFPVSSSPTTTTADLVEPTEPEPDDIIGDFFKKTNDKINDYFKTLGQKIKDFFLNLWNNPKVKWTIIAILSLLAFLILLPIIKLIVNILIIPFKVASKAIGSRNRDVERISRVKYKKPRKYKSS